jgi:hypothetical protein
MKHLKAFNVNEEYFGGKQLLNLHCTLKDAMNPKIDALIDYLTEYRAKINSDTSAFESSDTEKIDNMYSYIINDISLKNF